MKRNLFLFCLLGLVCNSCITSDLRDASTGRERDFEEVICVPDSVTVQFGFNYSGSLIYEFSIIKYKTNVSIDTIKLNSISITLEKDAPPISWQTFECWYSWDTIPSDSYSETIDNLPYIWDIKDKQIGYITFRAGYNISKKSIRKLYVSYDIEIGDKRIVRNQVEYRRKWFIGLPH